MKIERCRKERFAVIGKEGSTLDGDGFIQRLWETANARFAEVQPLAKTDECGNLIGIWGAMSDFSRSFQPWEDQFSKGLYLAGVECPVDAKAPEGWVKWIIPGYEYLRVDCETGDTFAQALQYLKQNGIPLVGAVHEFTSPTTGKSFLFFPVGAIVSGQSSSKPSALDRAMDCSIESSNSSSTW